MQFDGSRPHHPDRARGMLYRRILFQQNRVLLDSDFSALGDAVDSSMRRLAGMTGCAGGSPDQGWRITAGRALRLFVNIDDVQVSRGIGRRDHARPLAAELPVLSLEKMVAAPVLQACIPLRQVLPSQVVRLWIATDSTDPIPCRVVENRLQVGAAAFSGGPVSWSGTVPGGSELQALELPLYSLPDNGGYLPAGTHVIYVDSSLETLRIGLVETLPTPSQVSLHAGRYLVGGWDLELPQDQSLTLANPAQRVVAYMEARERVVSPQEDPGLAEVALGRGQDTTWRTKVQWRIGHLDVGSADSQQVKMAFAKAIASGSMLGTTVDAGQNSLDPCAIRTEEGYAGPENRLYRVEVHRPGPLGIATLLWSRDNASRRQPFQILAGNSRIGVAADGPLRDGELVELRGNLQEETVAAEAQLVGGKLRPAAARPGILALVDDQGLADDGLTRIFLLRQPQNPGTLVPLSAADLGTNLVVTRWEGLIPTVAGSSEYVVEEGLKIKVSGGEFWTGEAWTIVARRALPTVQSPAPAPSPEIHRSPLAILVKNGTIWEVECWLDGRFAPLCSLEARHIAVDGGPLGATNVQAALDLLTQSRGGCCPHSMGPGMPGDDDAARLVALIQQDLPADGGTICLEQGEYHFRTAILLDRPLKLKGCGRVLIHVEEPVMVPEGLRLELEDLSLWRQRAAVQAPHPVLLIGGRLDLSGCTVVNTVLQGTARVGIGILAGKEAQLRLSSSTVWAGVGLVGGNIVGPSVTMKSLDIEDTVFHCWNNCLILNNVRSLQIRRSTLDSGLPTSAGVGRAEIWTGTVEQRALRAAPYAGTAGTAAITGNVIQQLVCTENLIIGHPGMVIHQLEGARIAQNHIFSQYAAIQVDQRAADVQMENNRIEGLNGSGLLLKGRAERLRMVGGDVRIPTSASSVGLHLMADLKEVSLESIHVEVGEGTAIALASHADQLRIQNCTLVANQALMVSSTRAPEGLEIQGNRSYSDANNDGRGPTGFSFHNVRHLKLLDNVIQVIGRGPASGILLKDSEDLTLVGNRVEVRWGRALELQGKVARLSVRGGNLRVSTSPASIGIQLAAELKEVLIEAVHVEVPDGTTITLSQHADQLRIHGCTLVGNRTMISDSAWAPIALVIENNRSYSARNSEGRDAVGYFLIGGRNLYLHANHIQTVGTNSVALVLRDMQDVRLLENRLEAESRGMEIQGSIQRLSIVGGSVWTYNSDDAVGIMLVSQLKEVEIQGVHVEAGGGTAVLVATFVDQLHIHGCTLVGNQALMMNAGTAPDGVVIQNNRIWCDRNAKNRQPSGISLTNVRNVRVEGNHMQAGVPTHVFYADKCEDLEVVGNRIETPYVRFATEDAALIQGSTRVQLRQNRCNRIIRVGSTGGLLGLHSNVAVTVYGEGDELEATGNQLSAWCVLKARVRVVVDGNVVGSGDVADGVGTLEVSGLVGFVTAGNQSAVPTDGQITRNRAGGASVHTRGGWWKVDENTGNTLKVTYETRDEPGDTSQQSINRVEYHLQVLGNSMRSSLELSRAGNELGCGPLGNVSNNVTDSMTVKLSHGAWTIAGNMVHAKLGNAEGNGRLQILGYTGGRKTSVSVDGPLSTVIVRTGWMLPWCNLQILNNQATRLWVAPENLPQELGVAGWESLQMIGNLAQNPILNNWFLPRRVVALNLPDNPQ